jgi:hypothetical protein
MIPRVKSGKPIKIDRYTISSRVVFLGSKFATLSLLLAKSKSNAATKDTAKPEYPRKHVKT